MSTTTREPIRTVDGVELPVTGPWRVDPGHAEVSFVGRHFMITGPVACPIGTSSSGRKSGRGLPAVVPV